ncbi:MAG: hypothetical protein ACKVE4_04925 [Dissulfuribacterales bacterium]
MRISRNGTGFDEESVRQPVEELIKNNILPHVPGLYGDSDCNIAGKVPVQVMNDGDVLRL